MVTLVRWARRAALGLAGLYVAFCVMLSTTALVLAVREKVRERGKPVYVFPGPEAWPGGQRREE